MTFLKNLSFTLIFAFLLTSCSASKTTTLWVNSIKSDCTGGNGSRTCMQVYKGENLNDAKWLNFYAPIEGFKFETGYLQKLKVKETSLDKKDRPADASSITYSLIKVLEKKQDPALGLHDIWAVTNINGKAITATANTPTLEINLTKMKVYGTDGCNNYTGDITKLKSNQITFDKLASTQKLCLDMQIPDSFNNALSNTVSYKRENLTLTFFDLDSNETLRLKKVD
ncbi:DUF4377 domain-containing protein [Algibacter miyuki]|uniref:DUF4377 domain-containing protein n=1 Tax=Algibacter miyuki TaxID=1306933 RepID=A0ABV5H1Y2_9FLAO|nr:DUF4377 domain-containing protein [Algibacter miyuki]MDN3666405.1 DUF4377 domain-containing protein [Algibacter miyuki]